MKRTLLLGLAMLAMLFSLQQPLSAKQCSHQGKVKKKWDYVIVGGGTSGCELAYILSADKKTSVLLIEAGPNYDSDVRIETPAPYADFVATTYAALYDWQQVSVPQQYALDTYGGPATYPYLNGRLLGGGSSHNTMQYVRPTNYFLSQWEAASGSSLWGPDSVNAAFTQLENYNGTTNGPNNVRGTSGPLQVRQAPSIASTTLPAMQIQNIVENLPSPQNLTPYPNDYNDPSIPIGVCLQGQTYEAWQPTDPLNKRQSSSIVFLDPIIDATTGRATDGRKLLVLTNSSVNKVLFKKKTAIGVNYNNEHGVSNEVYAKKEVILSAGAFSCEVLMRSGVGNYSNPNAYTNSTQAPYALLSASGIKKVYDNPNVGQNLKNHPLILMGILATPGYQPLLPPDDFNALFAVPAFFPDPNDIPAGVRTMAIGIFSGLTPDTAAFAYLQAALFTTQSSGSVVIRSDNMNTVSLEDPNLFSDNGGGVNSKDFQTYFSFFQGIGDTGSGHVSSSYGPGYNMLLGLQADGWTLFQPSLATFQDADLLTTYILENVFHAFHYTGTNRMAPLENGGVVDAECRVYGVNRLRVIDNSIISVQPDCNTAATAFVIPAIIGPMIATGESKPFKSY